MKYLISLITIIFIHSACQNKTEQGINAAKITESIKSMSKLGTTEYTFSKVVAGSDNQWYTIGERRFILKCNAYVTAGIDASQIQFTDVDPVGKKIKLTIPKVEIITFNIPPDEFETIDLSPGTFRAKYTTKEINEFQQEGEKQVKEQLKEFDIKSETEKNAILFLDKILRTAGFESIEIKTTPTELFKN
jgi:hypothetical protein